MGIERKQGEILYLHYEIHFPKDKDIWVDCIPIVHDLQHWLGNTSFRKNPSICRDLLVKGEAHWEVRHGKLGKVKHVVKIKEYAVTKRWGKSHGLAQGNVTSIAGTNKS